MQAVPENAKSDGSRPGGLGYSAAASFDFIPALDGFRAISIGLVVLSHLGLGRFVPGLLGVTVFFFISGFLITRQLLAELTLNGGIALGRFYIRRALRLYPALLVAVAIGGAIFTLVGGSISAGDAAAAIFYFANYWELAGGFRSGLADVPHPYGVLWSLSVEEHYYLVYPVFVLVVGHRRTGSSVLIVVAIAAVTLWRTHLALACGLPDAGCLGGGSEWRLLHATDTRIDAILYGALLATLLDSALASRLLRALRSFWSLTLGIFLLVLSLVVRDELFRDTVRFSIQGVAMFLIVGNVLFTDGWGMPRSLLANGVMRAVGRWSYSLYLWHWIVLGVGLTVLPEHLRIPAHEGGLPVGSWFIFTAPVTALSFLAAMASYRWIERPVLALRHRFGSRRAGPSP